MNKNKVAYILVILAFALLISIAFYSSYKKAEYYQTTGYLSCEISNSYRNLSLNLSAELNETLPEALNCSSIFFVDEDKIIGRLDKL